MLKILGTVLWEISYLLNVSAIVALTDVTPPAIMVPSALVTVAPAGRKSRPVKIA